MTNPLLSKTKLPGRIFQLPSKGIFYESGVLADHVTDAEVEVQPLSGLAEMKLRSPDMLFSGRALREICLECIPDILKPEHLVSKDVDAIFCFLKIVTYGNEMFIKSIHDCPNRIVHDYTINIEPIVMSPNNSQLDHVDLLYNVKLSNNQVIKLKPVRFQDSIDMIHLQHEMEKDINETGNPDEVILERMVIRDLMSVISSVDEVTDKKMIEEWIRSLQKKYFKEIVNLSRASNDWGFNLNIDVTCKDCGEIYKHNLELDPINFFSG